MASPTPASPAAAGTIKATITDGLAVKIRGLDQRFRRSCNQILMLNNRIDELQKRYNLALSKNRRSSRYSLRLQLATMEGVRNMFYEYASRCADQLESLQNQLRAAGMEAEREASDDSSSEEETQ